MLMRRYAPAWSRSLGWPRPDSDETIRNTGETGGIVKRTAGGRAPIARSGEELSNRNAGGLA